MVEPTYVCRVCRSKDENLKKCTRCKSAWFCEKEVCRGQFPDHTTSELCKKSIHDNPEVLTGHRINVMRYTSYMFKDRIMDAVVERKSVPDNPSIEVVLCTLNSGEQDMCESYRTSRLLTSLSEGNLSPKIQQSLKKEFNKSSLNFRAFIGSWDEVIDSVEHKELGEMNTLTRCSILANIPTIREKSNGEVQLVTLYISRGVVHSIETVEYEKFTSSPKKKVSVSEK